MRLFWFVWLRSRLRRFRSDREGDTEKFLDAEYDKLEDGKRMLLWHGSRTTNFGGGRTSGLVRAARLIV